jgi:hypothetical protein
MSAYSLQDAAEAEQRLKEAQAFNGLAASNSKIAQRQAAELRRHSDAARCAVARVNASRRQLSPALFRRLTAFIWQAAFDLT